MTRPLLNQPAQVNADFRPHLHGVASLGTDETELVIGNILNCNYSYVETCDSVSLQLSVIVYQYLSQYQENTISYCRETEDFHNDNHFRERPE